MTYNQQSGPRAVFGQRNTGNAPAQFGQANTYGQPPQQQASYSSGGGDDSLTVGRPVKMLRFVSAFVDTIIMILMFVCIAVLDAKFNFFVDPDTGKTIENVGIPILLMLTVPGMLYGTLMEASKYQGTLGKIVTNTAVTDLDGDRLTLGRAFGRNLGKILSGLCPGYVSYFMVFFTDENQALHDLMSKTTVRQKLGGYGKVSMDEMFA